MRIHVIITTLFLSLFLKGQCQYVIDFGNSHTFQTSCGTIASSQWTVKNQRCTLYIPDLVMQDVSGNYVVPFTFTINQSGNLEFEDSLTLRHQINSGVWLTDTVIHGNGGTSVREITDSFFLAYHDTVRFTLDLLTNDPSEFWAIKSGDIAIDNAEPVLFLPVDLIEFTGVYDKQSNSVLIQWSTATEANCNHFVVERSVDAQNFWPIVNVNGNGNSNTLNNYQYTDLSFPETTMVYYRLKQFDNDGTVNILPVIAVNISNNGYPLIIKSSTGELITVLPTQTQRSGVLNIYSVQGLHLLQQTVEFALGFAEVNMQAIPKESICVFEFISDKEIVSRLVFVR